MKIQVLLLIIIALIVNVAAEAQTTDFDHDFGDISQEHLEMKVYDKDSTASSVGLLNYCKVYFGDYNARVRGVFYKHHIRIKVLDKSKFKASDVKLYSNDVYDIQSITAQTINWENGEKKISKVENIMEDEVNEYVKSYSIAFPNIKDGSIIEYQYVVFSYNYKGLKTFYFQNMRPNIRSEYRVAIPKSKSYAITTNGSEKAVEQGTQDFQDNNSVFDSKESFWIYEDVPAMDDEPYTTTIENYITKIKFQLRSEVLGYGGSQNFEGNVETDRKTYYVASWTGLASRYINTISPLFQEFADVRPVFNEVKPLVEKCTTKKDTILTIFTFVRDNMEWNGYHDILPNQRARDIFDQKEATSSDINFLLIALLYHFDIGTYPILLSTRGNGNVNYSYPIVNEFNNLIIAVHTGEEWLFLDATDKDLPYNLLPVADLNYEGLLMKNDTSYFINIPFETAESVTYMKAKLDEEGLLSGTINQAETTYIAAKSRGQIRKKGKEAYQKEYFNAFWVDAKATDIQFKNLDNPTKRFSQVINFEAENVGQVGGDLMYVDVFMGLGLDENPFQLEKRDYPVELPYPIKETILLNIEIPNGYAIESLPEPISYNLPNNDGSFVFAVQSKNNVITISSKMNIRKVKFEVNEYEAIKILFDNLVEKQTAQVVLKKN